MNLPRLRLRSAMILVALIAAMLAVCASFRSRALARQKAIEAVDRLHGFYDPKRVSLGPMNLGYDREHPIRDADIEALSDHLALFSNLEMLDLQECRQVTDRGIVSLPSLPKLKYLLLDGTSVTEEGIKELRRRYHGVEFSL
jgi:hypothetical protein